MSLFHTHQQIIFISVLNFFALLLSTASELSPISPESPIHSQWQEQDMEVLSSSGRGQIEILGAWFAKRYVQSGLLDASNGRTHWRASKSDRALESAFDFVKGYNDTIGNQVINYSQ